MLIQLTRYWTRKFNKKEVYLLSINKGLVLINIHRKSIEDGLLRVYESH
ncbi:hypothetical protein MKY19_22730 [Paenibacillus sp. FSL R5-0744]